MARQSLQSFARQQRLALSARLARGIIAQSSRYHEHQHFEPADEAEHERSYDQPELPDYCANCGARCVDHYNGRCPK